MRQFEESEIVDEGSVGACEVRMRNNLRDSNSDAFTGISKIMDANDHIERG